VGFGRRTFSHIVQQCRKEKRQTGSRSLLNTGMGLLPVSRLTPGHFGTVTGSPASLHANVKSKAVSSPVRSSACTPTGHHVWEVRIQEYGIKDLMADITHALLL